MYNYFNAVCTTKTLWKKKWLEFFLCCFLVLFESHSKHSSDVPVTVIHFHHIDWEHVTFSVLPVSCIGPCIMIVKCSRSSAELATRCILSKSITSHALGTHAANVHENGTTSIPSKSILHTVGYLALQCLRITAYISVFGIIIRNPSFPMTFDGFQNRYFIANTVIFAIYFTLIILWTFVQNITM